MTLNCKKNNIRNHTPWGWVKGHGGKKKKFYFNVFNGTFFLLLGWGISISILPWGPTIYVAGLTITLRVRFHLALFIPVYFFHCIFFRHLFNQVPFQTMWTKKSTLLSNYLQQLRNLILKMITISTEMVFHISNYFGQRMMTWKAKVTTSKFSSLQNQTGDRWKH